MSVNDICGNEDLQVESYSTTKDGPASSEIAVRLVSFAGCYRPHPLNRIKHTESFDIPAALILRLGKGIP